MNSTDLNKLTDENFKHLIKNDKFDLFETIEPIYLFGDSYFVKIYKLNYDDTITLQKIFNSIRNTSIASINKLSPSIITIRMLKNKIDNTLTQYEIYIVTEKFIKVIPTEEEINSLYNQLASYSIYNKSNEFFKINNEPNSQLIISNFMNSTLCHSETETKLLYRNNNDIEDGKKNKILNEAKLSLKLLNSKQRIII